MEDLHWLHFVFSSWSVFAHSAPAVVMVAADRTPMQLSNSSCAFRIQFSYAAVFARSLVKMGLCSHSMKHTAMRIIAWRKSIFLCYDPANWKLFLHLLKNEREFEYYALKPIQSDKAWVKSYRVKITPCKHTTLFQRLYNVHNVGTTLYKHMTQATLSFR